MTIQNSAILDLRGVTRSFAQGGEIVKALKKTDFIANAGEMVAIIGPSGSGKSTFLTIAGGLQSPSRGKVLLNGIDISDLSLRQLSVVRLREVGFILQASNLVSFLTVKKQLQLLDKVSKRKTDEKAMNTLLKDLSIEKLRDKYPQELSGGERQRVVIAKALYGDSKLILADEPTASLDTKKAHEVVGLLAHETHSQMKATIMVTHDERLIRYCDKVYEMSDGVLTQRESHQKLQ